MNHDLVSFL